ncbi:MAG: response regulator [Bdellovibrionales bacterium]|nr:response regulator [Bdellovibrionales bacterium]
MNERLGLRKVLIVDDEIEILDYLSGYMGDLNLKAETAVDGKTAVEKLTGEPFQAVICDIKMPGMSGLECMAECHKRGIFVPFIYLTGYADTPNILQAVRLGAMDFLSKPFKVDELEEVLFRVLDIGARRERILQDLEAENPKLFEKYKHHNRMISLLRATNNQRRKAG